MNVIIITKVHHPENQLLGRHFSFYVIEKKTRPIIPKSCILMKNCGPEFDHHYGTRITHFVKGQKANVSEKKT